MQLDDHLINKILSYRGKHPIITGCIPRCVMSVWDLLQVAIRDNKIVLVQWLILLGFEKFVKDHVCELAALNGHLSTLQWARANQCPWDQETCINACEINNTEILEWILDNGWVGDCSPIALCAIKNGDLKLLKRVKDLNCEMDEDMFEYAARIGDLDTLKFLKDNNCPWDEYVCEAAAYFGHFEVLKWLQLNNCPWDGDTYARALACGHKEICKWLCDNGCPWVEVTSERIKELSYFNY